MISCKCLCILLCSLFFLQITDRKYPKLKEVDDVLGGAAAWENVDSTSGNAFHFQPLVDSMQHRYFCIEFLFYSLNE